MGSPGPWPCATVPRARVAEVYDPGVPTTAHATWSIGCGPEAWAKRTPPRTSSARGTGTAPLDSKRVPAAIGPSSRVRLGRPHSRHCRTLPLRDRHASLGDEGARAQPRGGAGRRALRRERIVRRSGSDGCPIRSRPHSARRRTATSSATRRAACPSPAHCRPCDPGISKSAPRSGPRPP
jgi:hypothetical protein